MKTKKQHEADILTIINDKKVMFISHIFGYYTDCSRQQFYNLGLDKLDSIKEAIRHNRAMARGHMINSWIGSDNPTLQIAAYRLCCDDEDELKKLAQKQVDVTSGQKNLQVIVKDESEKQAIENIASINI